MKDSVFHTDTEKIDPEYITNAVQHVSLYSNLGSPKMCICTSSQLRQDSDIIKLFITEIKYIFTDLHFEKKCELG